MCKNFNHTLKWAFDRFTVYLMLKMNIVEISYHSILTYGTKYATIFELVDGAQTNKQTKNIYLFIALVSFSIENTTHTA